jgi:putative nucleotidyltransferase with HDIG domain
MSQSVDTRAEVTQEERATILRLFPHTEQIADEQLREQVLTVWVRQWRRSSWEDPEDCPFMPGLEVGPRFSLVKHTNSVVKNALRMAETLEEDFEVVVDMDRLLAICLLHDVSKIMEYEDGVDGVSVLSAAGETFPHATLGAVEAHDAGVPDLVCKTIVLHPYHPPHTFLKPTCVEHCLQHWSDLGTADALFFLDGKPTHMEKRRLFEAIPT